MQAIILAAGRGSRMKKLSKDRPKCLLELGGKTLLEWQTDALQSAGISNITIVTGYRSEALKKLPYKCFNNHNWAKTNMVRSLMCASPLLDKRPCIITYSDIVYHFSIISTLKKTPGEIVITYDQKWESLWKERFKNPLDDAEQFSTVNKKLISIGAKASSLKEIEGQYMGLLKITPKGWNEIKKTFNSLSISSQDALDMTSLLQILLNNNILINTASIQGKWCEIDREEDLHLYKKKLHCSGWVHDWRYEYE